MNLHYKNRYDNFIGCIKNLGNRTLTEYTEIHHIQPKCLKGTDDPNNLIELTLREHFLAHWLLWKSYPDYLPLASAFLQMNHKNPHLSFKGFQGRITSKTYKELKTSVYNKLREYTTDKVNVRDNQGNLITLSKEEYHKQEQYKFHTTGKIYVLDTHLDEWVYITSELYSINKDRYKSRMSLDGFPHGNSDMDTCIMKYKFLNTETNEIVKMSKSEAKRRNKEYGYKKLVHIQKKNVKCMDKTGDIYYVPLIDYDPSKHRFYLSGTVNVFDLLENQQKIIPLNEYNLNKNRYLTSTKGKVLAKDQTGKNVLVTKKEFDNGQYVGQTKGLTTVLDKTTGEFLQITKKEFTQNRDRYVGPNHGKVNVINKITGERKQIPKEDFDKEIHAGIGNKKLLFKCRNKLTNKEKNINIYEWDLVKNQYDILEMDKFQIALNCK